MVANVIARAAPGLRLNEHLEEAPLVAHAPDLKRFLATYSGPC